MSKGGVFGKYLNTCQSVFVATLATDMVYTHTDGHPPTYIN